LWVDITPMARQNWILWITRAKQPETPRRRIENACGMLGTTWSREGSMSIDVIPA